MGGGGGKEKLLTPGNFMCEHIKVSADKRQLIFSANTGSDKWDIDRRHIAKVNIDAANMQALTSGTGLEWAPILTEDGNTVAFISATAQQCPTPAILKLNGDSKMQLIGASLIPSELPQQKLITPKQVIFPSAVGLIFHTVLFLSYRHESKKTDFVS